MTTSKSNMSFKVDGNVVAWNLLDGEVRARMATRNHPEKKKQLIESGVIGSSSEITDFILKHPEVFGSKKFIHSDGTNFFGEIVPMAPVYTGEDSEGLKTRMIFGCDLSEKEAARMGGFIKDLQGLKEKPEIKQIVSQTEAYKDSIQRAWELNERQIMSHIYGILGYVPESGQVDTYIVFPNFNTHRTYQNSNTRTSLFFGKPNERNINKILAHLTHQAVHQPMLPYKKSMTQAQKEKFHAFIKFLTDKEIYTSLSGKSALEIVTQKEDSELMAKIYPYWLGYRFRNAKKMGLNPAGEIEKVIDQDKKYFESLPKGSKKRALYASYEFEKLSPEKIAEFFRDKKGIDPYKFAQLDFDDKTPVYKASYLKKRAKNVPSVPEAR